MSGMRGALAIAAMLVLSACDDRPNKDFEQVMKDRQAESIGDRYATLELNMPTQIRYSNQKKELKEAFANGQADTFRAVYDGLLAQLDTEKTLNRQGTLFKMCRAAFAEASAWEKGGGNDAQGRDEAVAALRSCRADAKKAGAENALLARFASTGIAMVGAKTVGQGAGDPGSSIWRQGERFVSEDKPGFQLKLKSLKGV